MDEMNKLDLTGIFSEGYGLIPKKLIRSKLDKNSKLILTYMLSFTGAGDVCFPSIDTICNDLDLSKPTVIKSIKLMHEKNIIRKERLKSDNPFNHKNKYKMIFLYHDLPSEFYRDGKNILPSEGKQILLPIDEPVLPSYNNNIINNNIDNNKDPEGKNKNEKNKKYIPLAQLIYSEHLKHDPDFLKGDKLEITFNRWADDIRLLVEKDKRSYLDIENVIKWTQSPGNFWIPNILSGKKLREKFPQLIAQYKQSLNKGQPENQKSGYNKDWDSKNAGSLDRFQGVK